jgi:uncharacterized damage-inducible protein DinB
MTAKDIETLFDYSYWANRKLFEVLSQLTPKEFTQPVAGSYGSIRNTLVHMMSTEWGWLDRSGGTPRESRLVPTDYPTFASVTEQWGRIEGHLRDFLASLRDEDLDRVVEFAIGDGPRQALSVRQMMHHAAVHSVHHRGQIALFLRSLGYVPGNFDICFYYSETGNSHPATPQL